MPHAFHLSGHGEVLFGRIGRWLADPVREFTVSGPDAGPYALAEGPDGALWFTLVHQDGIGRRGEDGHLTTHPVGAGPTVIAQGPDGACGSPTYRAHRIGRITVDGSVSSFAPHTAGGGPFGIAPGPDGAMWFTLSGATASAASPVDAK